METCKYRIVSGLMSVAKKHKEKLKRYTEIKMTDDLQFFFNLSLILLMEEIRLTTWDVKNPVNTGINYLSTGAGFPPSTVAAVGTLKSLVF